MKRFVLVNKLKGVYDDSNPISVSDLIPLGGGHDDTSEMASINNSGGTVIQSLSVDEFGHITAGGSINLDGRYLKTLPAHGHSWNEINSKPTLDNYVKWNLQTNGVQRLGVTSEGQVNFVNGNHVAITYGAGGQVIVGLNKTFVETETDPTVPAHVKAITQANINTWNAAGSSQDNKIRTISIDPADLPSAYTTADLAAWVNSMGLTISETELIIIKMESGLEPETDAYVARVEADGGTIIDRNYVDLAYKLLKSEGRINQSYSWLSASMGVKKNASNKVSKLYSLKGAAWDLLGTGINSMTWYSTGQDNAPEILIDKVEAAAMKPTSLISIAQPNTIFTVGSINYQASNQYLYDGFTSSGRHLLLRNNQGAWTFGSSPFIDFTQSIGTTTHIMQGNYAGSNSRLYVDGIALGAGPVNAGSSAFEYITLFNYHGNDKQYNMGGKFKDLLVLGSGMTTAGTAFTQFFNTKYNL